MGAGAGYQEGGYWCICSQPFLLPLLQGEIGLPGPPGHDGDKVSNTAYSKDSVCGSPPGSVNRRAQEQAQKSKEG